MHFVIEINLFRGALKALKKPELHLLISAIHATSFMIFLYHRQGRCLRLPKDSPPGKGVRRGKVITNPVKPYSLVNYTLIRLFFIRLLVNRQTVHIRSKQTYFISVDLIFLGGHFTISSQTNSFLNNILSTTVQPDSVRKIRCTH